MGTLSAPVLTASAGAGTVSLNWSSVPAPGPGTVSYYVTRSGGAVGGNCPATAASVNSCQDSGLVRGSYTYTVTAVWASWSATSTPVTVSLASGAPTTLVFLTEPGGAAGGTAFSAQPAVEVEDAAGNLVSTDASTVALAITTNPSGGTLSGCAQTESGGVVTFSGCAIDKAGAGYVLTATDGSLTPALSTPFTVAVGPAAQLAFSQAPSSATSGTAFSKQPVVDVEDAGGNLVTSDSGSVTLALGANPSGGTLAGCSQVTVAGVVTFSGCHVDKAGSGYTLVASRTGITSATSGAFTVAPGAATQLVITRQPAGATGGTPFSTQLGVAVEDGAGNTVTSDASSVTLAIASGPSGAALAGCTQVESAGIVNFSGCAINKAGTGYTLKATDGVLTSAVSASFSVSVGPASAFTISAATTTPTAGASDTLTITAQDAGGNTVTAFTGTHTLTFSGADTSPAGTAPTVTNASGTAVAFGSPVTVSFSSGVASAAAMKLYDAETAHLAATDTSDGVLTTSPLAVTVSAGTASTLRFVNCSDASASYSSATCAAPIAMGMGTTLSAYLETADAYGNQSAPTLAAVVTLTGSDSTDFTLSNGLLTIGPGSAVSSSFTVTSANKTATDTLTATAAGFGTATLALTS